MGTSDVELQGLVKRVAKLERQNRFWKLSGLLAALIFATSLAIGVKAQQEHPNIAPALKSIEAQAFVLTDADGVTRGSFTAKNGVPRLELYSSAGKVTWSTSPRIVTEGR
jgi:hypothetical protein